MCGKFSIHLKLFVQISGGHDQYVTVHEGAWQGKVYYISLHISILSDLEIPISYIFLKLVYVVVFCYNFAFSALCAYRM